MFVLFVVMCNLFSNSKLIVTFIPTFIFGNSATFFSASEWQCWESIPSRSGARGPSLPHWPCPIEIMTEGHCQGSSCYEGTSFYLR